MHIHIYVHTYHLCALPSKHIKEKEMIILFTKKRGNKKSGFIMFFSAFRIWWVSSEITAKSWHRVNAEALNRLSNDSYFPYYIKLLFMLMWYSDQLNLEMMAFKVMVDFVAKLWYMKNSYLLLAAFLPKVPVI